MQEVKPLCQSRQVVGLGVGAGWGWGGAASGAGVGWAAQGGGGGGAVFSQLTFLDFLFLKI